MSRITLAYELTLKVASKPAFWELTKNRTSRCRMPAHMRRMITVDIGVRIRLTKKSPTPPANASPVSPGSAKSGAQISPRIQLSRAEIRAQITAKPAGFKMSLRHAMLRKKAPGWVTTATTVLVKLPTGSDKLNSPPRLPTGPHRGPPRGCLPASPPDSGLDSSPGLPEPLPVLKSIRFSSLKTPTT